MDNNIRVNQVLMQQVLDSFSTFTGIRATFDYGDKVLFGNNCCLSRFCTELRTIAPFEQRCVNCDKVAKAEVIRQKNIYVYKCHMGFWEAIAPVVVQGNIVSYLTIGQIVDRNNKVQTFDFVCNQLKNHGVAQPAIERLSKLMKELKTFTYDEVEAGAKLLKITADYLSYQQVVSISYSQLIDKVVYYLQHNYSRPITGNDIEAATEYRYTYICDIFKQKMGITITEYLEKIRIDHAKELLENTSLKIYEISEKCGYNSSYYFGRVFKKNLNCTPQEYRKDKTTG